MYINSIHAFIGGASVSEEGETNQYLCQSLCWRESKSHCEFRLPLAWCGHFHLQGSWYVLLPECTEYAIHDRACTVWDGSEFLSLSLSLSLSPCLSSRYQESHRTILGRSWWESQLYTMWVKQLLDLSQIASTYRMIKVCITMYSAMVG